MRRSGEGVLLGKVTSGRVIRAPGLPSMLEGVPHPHFVAPARGDVVPMLRASRGRALRSHARADERGVRLPFGATWGCPGITETTWLGWHLLDGVGAWVAGCVCIMYGAPLHACVDPWGAPYGRGDGSEGS